MNTGAWDYAYVFALAYSTARGGGGAANQLDNADIDQGVNHPDIVRITGVARQDGRNDYAINVGR